MQLRVGNRTRVAQLTALDPGAFAFVMATGIVAVAAADEGLPLLSDGLLALACLAWVALGAALMGRVLRGTAGRRSVSSRPRLSAFALVAATAVIGARLAQAREESPSLVLWTIALALWVLLLVMRPRTDDVRGNSLLVVVATESLAVLGALLGPSRGTPLLLVALTCWLLGLIAYPAVSCAIARAANRSRRFDPDLWIVMGALAIATLAGSELLLAARGSHSLHELTAGWLADVDLGTWALASALIGPLLVAELCTRSSWRYEQHRWSFVFPLAMYAVATQTLGRADSLSVLSPIAQAFFVVALAAWTLVTSGLAHRIAA